MCRGAVARSCLAVLVAAAAIAGCRDDGAPAVRPSPEPVRAVQVHVEPRAARAAAGAGVDLRAVVDDAVAAASDRLRLPPVDVTVGVDPAEAIPEVGVGGRTDVTGAVSISLDPTHDRFRRALEVWLPVMVAHELHHAVRAETGPGYGSKVVDAMVSEGLADAFTEEVHPNAPPSPWTRALGRQATCRWWREAQRERGHYGHAVWFFGAGRIPRWAGYTVGYRLVRSYLREHPGRSAADLATIRARTLMSRAALCRGRA